MSYQPIISSTPTHLLPEELLNELIAALNPFFIFWGEFTVNPELNMLTLIVGEADCKPSNFEKADALLKEHPQLRHRIYTQSYAMEQIEAGNLFFIENLLLGNVVYGQQELGFPFMNSTLCLNDLIGRSKRAFDKELKKIDAFSKGASSHFEKGHYAQSTFAYHQTMELLFRAAECALMGRNKITHRLREHQEYCHGFITSLASFFDLNDLEEAATMELLDQSYCAARYQSDFEPSIEAVDMLYYKTEQLFILVKSLFYFSWQRCFVASYKKDKSDETGEKIAVVVEATNDTSVETAEVLPHMDSEEPQSISIKRGNYETEDELLIRVIELLKTKLELDSVFLISKYGDSRSMEVHLEQTIPFLQNTTIYTLMLVSNTPASLGPAAISDYIYKETEGNCRVYAILYTVNEVFEKRNYGSHFLESIITQSQWAYYASEKNYGPNFQVNYHPLMVANIEKIWEDRSSKAAYLLNLMENDGFTNYDFNITLTIIRLAIEQTCIGMAQVFWEYKPKQSSLPYLLHLCSHFSNTPTAIFHKTTYENQRMYHLICNARRMLRNNKNPKVNCNDSETAISIAEEFVRLAREEVSDHIKHLRTLAEAYKTKCANEWRKRL